jgi:tetratricopeptide (TPR) repeat protein
VAFVSLGLIACGAYGMRRKRDHKTRSAPADKLTIYVAHLEGDDAVGTARACVIDTIKQELGPELIYVLPEGKLLNLPTDASQDDEEAGNIAEDARKLLTKRGGQLLIWGRVLTIGQKIVLRLQVVDANGEATGALGQKFILTSKGKLGADFAPEMRRCLAALVLALASPAVELGRADLREKMIELLTRIEHLRGRLGESFSADERAQIVFSYALLLFVLGEEDPDTERLEKSVEAFQEAIKGLTRERDPRNRALTQHNLGLALLRLGERETGTERLEGAVETFREALKELRRERDPLTWATAQNSLCAALTRLGEREKETNRLNEAMEACREALKEWTRDRVPYNWAIGQNSLGLVLMSLGEREEGTEKLDEAVAAFQEALKELTRDRNPLDWALTHYNLGVALMKLGERETGTGRLSEAVETYREALKEWTRQRVPSKWAMAQYNLGIAFARLGESEVAPLVRTVFPLR